MSGTSLHFSSVQDLRLAHVDTDKLLKEGSLKVGSHRYSVSLANDGSIAVNRDHNNASQIKRFFSATKELVSHRIMDDSDSSRSDRIADSLNGHKIRNDREKAMQQQTRFQATTGFTEIGRPSSSLRATQPNVAASTQKPAPEPQLTFEHFLKAEESRADHYNEYPNEGLARKEYNRYLQSHPKMSAAKHTPQASAVNKHIATASTEPKRTLDDFVRDEKARADYHGEAPNLTLAKDKYKEHIQSQSPQSGSSRIRTSVASHRMQPQASLTPRQELDNARERQAAADYYGYQSDLTPAEKKMIEAESRIPRQTLSRSLGHTSDTQALSKEERLSNRFNNLKNTIAQLPPEEKRIAEKTLKTFEHTANQGALSLDKQREYLIAIKEQVKNIASDPTSAFANMRMLRDELRDLRR